MKRKLLKQKTQIHDDDSN